MQNFIAQSMRRFGLAPKNTVTPASPSGGSASSITNNPLSHMEVEGNYAYSTLTYPLDLQTRTDLGHYMMFYVNIPNESAYGATSDKQRSELNAKAEASQKFAGAKGMSDKEKAQRSILNNKRGFAANAGTAGSFNAEGRTWKAGETDKVIHREQKSSNIKSITKRTADAITLYMPNTGITSQHTPKWADSELGGKIGEAAGRVQNGFNNGVWGGIQGFLAQAMGEVKNMGTDLVGAAAGGDLKAARDKVSNQAENQFIETFFKGIDLRKFDFSWQFRPKSPEEVYEVRKIIEKFKFHSLPELPSGNRHGRYFTVPASFDIFYMYRGDENQWINKISTCVCGGVNINYSPTAWQTFRPIKEDKWPQGAPPTEIDMTLNFMETRIITKQDVLEGF